MRPGPAILLHYSSKHKFLADAHLTDRRSDTQTQTGTILFFIQEFKKTFLKLGLSYDKNTPVSYTHLTLPTNREV